jgi:hypothetical protein
VIPTIEGVAVDADAADPRVDPSAFGRPAAIGDVELADRLAGVFLSDADGRAAQVEAAIGARRRRCPARPCRDRADRGPRRGNRPVRAGARLGGRLEGVATDDPGWDVPIGPTGSAARRGDEGTPGWRGDPRLAHARTARRGRPRPEQERRLEDVHAGDHERDDERQRVTDQPAAGGRERRDGEEHEAHAAHEAAMSVPVIARDPALG